MARKKAEEMTEEEKADVAEQEAEKKRLEDEHRTELAKQQEALIKTTEAKAKAEAMLETFKSLNNTQQAPKEWTAEQWKEFEEKTGLNKDQLLIVDNIAKAHIDTARKSFDDRAKDAEERAKRAEERLQGFEKDKSYDGYKKDYFSKNPAYARYEKDFDEFVNLLSPEAKTDPAKLNDVFSKASVYVKGKVGEKTLKTTTGSNRFDNGDGTQDDIESGEVDLTGLRESEQLVVKRILPTKEGSEKLKKYQHDLKGEGGVSYNGKEDWSKYSKK